MGRRKRTRVERETEITISYRMRLSISAQPERIKFFRTAADTSRRALHASTDNLAMDGGEVAQATCKEQPFDVGFHPTSGVFVAGLITGEVRAASRVARRPAADARRRGKTLGAVPPTPRA